MPHRPSIQIPLQLNQANLCACAGAFCIFPHFQLGGGGSLTFSQHRHHHHNHYYHHVDCQTSSSAFSNAIKMGRQRHNNNNHQTAFACPAGGTMLCLMLYVSVYTHKWPLPLHTYTYILFNVFFIFILQVLGTIIFGVGLWLAVDKHSLIALLKLVESERIEVRPSEDGGFPKIPPNSGWKCCRRNTPFFYVEKAPRKHCIPPSYNAIYTQPIEVCNSHIEIVVNQPRNIDQPHVQVLQ